MLAHFDGKAWSEHVITNPEHPSRIQLAVAPDGTAYVAENAAWRATPKKLTKIDLPANTDLNGIALAKSATEVWLEVGAPGSRYLLRLDGMRRTRIAMRDSGVLVNERRSVVAGAGKTWMFQGPVIWQLVPPGDKAPPSQKLRFETSGTLTIEPR